MVPRMNYVIIWFQYDVYLDFINTMWHGHIYLLLLFFCINVIFFLLIIIIVFILAGHILQTYCRH